MAEQYVIGVDVGGTKVAAGLVNSSGEITHQMRVPMVAEDAVAGLAAVISAIDSVSAAAKLEPNIQGSISGIGICAPGPLDPRTGVVINPPNLPGWRNFPLTAEISKAYRLPVRVDNDGNAAALAEALWGVGRGYRNVFCTTLGTGIGTGIVFDRRIYHGRTGSAGEGGHVSIDYNGPRCGCGKRGCIEALCSGPAIAQRARARLAESNTPSRMRELAGGNLEKLTTENVAEAFQAGDALAREVLEATADLLTVWLGNMIDLLEPDVIVFGGGVAQLMSQFFPRMQNELPKWSINARCCEIPLLLAKYGSDAGIAGAAALCRE